MLHTKISGKYFFKEMSSEHFVLYNSVIFWLVLQICEARRISNKCIELQWVRHTSGVCVRKCPHSLTEQRKSHRNKCVTVSILFISVFQRKKLGSRNTHNAHTRQQTGRPEHISGHWMWRVAKICLLMVWVGSQNMWSSASQGNLSIQQTTSKKLHSANVWRASDKVRCRAMAELQNGVGSRFVFEAYIHSKSTFPGGCFQQRLMGIFSMP